MKRETALIALSLIACTTCCIVEDNDTRLQYLGVWFVSQNNGSSGGTEHRTNVPGAGVVLSNFTGSAVAVFGLAGRSGAQFTFAISDGGPTVLCDARPNTTYHQTELCSIGGLNESVPHTLAITHNDTAERWLNFDFLKIDSPSLPGGTTTPSVSVTSTPSSSYSTLTMSSNPSIPPTGSEAPMSSPSCSTPVTSSLLSTLTGPETCTPSSPCSSSVTMPSNPSNSLSAPTASETSTSSTMYSESSIALSPPTSGSTRATLVSFATPAYMPSVIPHRSSTESGILIASVVGSLFFLAVAGVGGFALYRWVQHRRRMKEFALPLERGPFFGSDRAERGNHGFRTGDMIAWNTLPKPSYSDPYSGFAPQAVLSPSPSPPAVPANRRERSLPPVPECATLLPSRLAFLHPPSSEDSASGEESPLSSAFPIPRLHRAAGAFRLQPVVWYSTSSSGGLSTDRQSNNPPRSRNDRSDRIAPRGPRPRYL